MSNEKVKKYCNQLRNQVKEDMVDFSGLTQSYYQLLKDSNSRNLNEEIIKELKGYSELDFIRDNLNELFNKKNILGKEDLENGLMKISKKIIEAVDVQSSQDIYNIEIEKSNKIIKDEIMDWDYFSSYFDRSFEYWQIKEAIGWIAGYIETEDYDPNKILVFNSEKELNKKQTLKNILTDINKKSLTARQPFITKINKEQKDNSNFGFQFRAAGSGEIDVMLWSEKKQKAIALSVTRDRSFQIEGNQFLRHYVQMLATTLIIKNKYKKEDITKLEARNYLKSGDYRSDRRLKDFYKLNKNIKEEIFHKVDNHSGDEYKVNNFFLRDLTYVRQEIAKQGGMDFTGNLKITKTEMDELLKLGKENLDYTYFGEVLKTDDFMQELTSALNSFAYTSNFNNVSNIEVGLENSFNFLDQLNFRYNLSNNQDSFRQGLEMTATILIMKNSEFEPIAEGYMEGKVFSAERNNLYKSVGNLLKLIKDKDDIKKYLTEDLGMESGLAEKVDKTIKSNFFLSDLKEKFSKIKSSQSELVTDQETTLLLAENIYQKEMIKSLLCQKKEECQSPSNTVTEKKSI
jgi:hypothetical protein